MSSPFGGKGSGSGSSPTSSTPGDITPLAAGLENLAGGIVNIAGEQTGAAQPFISGGTSQYQAGLAGQLTPAQQALMDFTSNQRNVATTTGYSNLGLGGSTMEMQDKNANSLAELAQQVGIDFQNEQAGIEGARLGEGFLGNAAASLGGAGTELFNAGSLLGNQQAGNLQSKSALNNALGSLAGVSSGNQSGGLLSNLGGLFSNSSGGGGGLGSLFGKGGGTAVDTGIGSILGGDTGLVGTGAAAGAGGITDTALIDTGLSLAAA